MKRSDKDFDMDASVVGLLETVDLADPTQVDPNSVRLQGLLSRLEDLVGDADVDVDAPIEDEPVQGRQ